MEAIINFLATGPSPEKILTFRPPESAVKRLRELLAKNREVRLTDDEEEKLDEFEEAELLMTARRSSSRFTCLLRRPRIPVTVEADVTIDKSADLETVTAGENLTYTLKVTNEGPSDAAGVSVTDTLPAGVTLVSAPGTCTGTTTITCTVGTVAADGSATFTIVAKVNSSTAAGTVLTNSASVSTTTPESNTENNSDSTETDVVTEADVRISKTASPDPVAPGENLTYTVVVTNDGPSDALAVVVTDTLPTGVSFVSAAGCTHLQGTVTCTAGTVASGANRTFTIVVSVPSNTADGTVLTNEVSVSSETSDPNEENNTAEIETTVRPQADLDIDKTGPDTGCPTAASSWPELAQLDFHERHCVRARDGIRDAGRFFASRISADNDRCSELQGRGSTVCGVGGGGNGTAANQLRWG